MMDTSEVMFSGTNALSYRFTHEFKDRDAVEGKIADAVAAIDQVMTDEAAELQRKNPLLNMAAPLPSAVSASLIDDLLLLTVSIPNPGILPTAMHAAIVAAIGPVPRAP